MKLFIGIDVQIKRGCSYFILNQDLEYVDSGWLKIGSNQEVCSDLLKTIGLLEVNRYENLAIGIDAPRILLNKPRDWYWRRGRWRPRRAREKGYGRHCEVVIKALDIANPQWTGLSHVCPDWMKLGFGLFDCLSDFDHVYEVFPSASYKMLQEQKKLLVSISFSEFYHGPKDMLDACVAALTVHQFLNNHGSEVGGGDGLGTIILPAPLSVDETNLVLHWPGTKSETVEQ